jgi:hypothetical protein
MLAAALTSVCRDSKRHPGVGDAGADETGAEMGNAPNQCVTDGVVPALEEAAMVK